MGLATCTKCAAGTAQPLKAQTDASACEPCHAGKYQPVQGQTFCVPCGVGYYMVLLALGVHGMRCRPARHWTWQNHARGRLCHLLPWSLRVRAAAVQCTECGIGKFSTTTGAVDAATCEHCDWGQYTLDTAATSCKSCAAGHYGEKQGTAKGLMTHCLRCPHGRYQRFDGSTSCEVRGGPLHGRIRVQATNANRAQRIMSTPCACTGATAARTCYRKSLIARSPTGVSGAHARARVAEAQNRVHGRP